MGALIQMLQEDATLMFMDAMKSAYPQPEGLMASAWAFGMNAVISYVPGMYV